MIRLILFRLLNDLEVCNRKNLLNMHILSSYIYLLYLFQITQILLYEKIVLSWFFSPTKRNTEPIAEVSKNPINSFWADLPFLYSLKNKSLRFSNIFRGYRKTTVVRNGKISFEEFPLDNQPTVINGEKIAGFSLKKKLRRNANRSCST